MSEIPPRSLSATDLDGLELDVESFQTHCRTVLGLDGSVQKPSDDGLLDLGTLIVGEIRFRVTYALRQPPANAAAIVNGRTGGDRALILLPTSAEEVSGVSCVALDHPLPTRRAFVRAIAAKLSLTDQIPAIETAPDRARLVVDTVRGKVWFDGIEVVGLPLGTHQFKFTEMLARRAPRFVPQNELVDVLSSGPNDGNQSARTAKAKARKAFQAALAAVGKSFDDPFKSENGGYRLTVCAHVV